MPRPALILNLKFVGDRREPKDREGAACLPRCSPLVLRERERTITTPERRLLIAMIDHAMSEIAKSAERPYDKKLRRQAEHTWAWILYDLERDDEDDGLLFDEVCGLLNLDTSAMRNGLRKFERRAWESGQELARLTLEREHERRMDRWNHTAI